MKLSFCRAHGILACVLIGVVTSSAVPARAPALDAETAVQSAPSLPDMAALVATVAELRTELAYLRDRQQIHDVYLRYMRGFDRNDVVLLKSAFWPEVQINYGTQSNTLDEFISRHLNFHTTQLKTWGHLLTNETVDIDGDVAHVETYVTGLWMAKDKTSSTYGTPIAGGRYIDRLDRRNGEWRISVREFIPHFQLKADTDTSVLDSYVKNAKSRCAIGTWDKRDPSYRRPLNPREDKEIGPACGN